MLNIFIKEIKFYGLTSIYIIKNATNLDRFKMKQVYNLEMQ